MSRIAIRPGRPWTGEGELELEAALKPDMIDFAKLRGSLDLTIGIFHITDKFGIDGEPSCRLYLAGVVPSNARMELTELDATGSEIVLITLVMKYDRLTFLFGSNPLDMMAAAV